MASILKKLRHPGAIAWLAATLIRVLGWTIRVEVRDQAGVSSKEGVVRPIIWLFWHNRVLVMPYFQRRYFSHRQGAVLTSPSGDGEIIARIMKRFGHEAIRGSSNKRPAAALREMVRAMQEGNDIAITPDGPRGPQFEFQPGAVKLAQLSQSALMPVHLQYQRAWQMKTWDGFLIPKPFTRARLTLAPLTEVPRLATPEALERCRVEMEQAMRREADKPWD